MSAADWLGLIGHFLSLSLLAVGGAITTAPEMHRYLVGEQHWLSDAQFSSSIALAQAAPGPNVLFVALMGWNIGVNAAGGMQAGALAWALGLGAGMASMVSFLLPSVLLTFYAGRWGQRNREHIGLRAFKAGMAPVVVGLLAATGWVLASSLAGMLTNWHVWLLSSVVALLVWRTRIHMLWLLAVGGALGWSGWI